MNSNFNNKTGSVSWQSASNIALIKYWGKKGFQLPANPSLSITLSKSFSETKIDFSPGSGSIDFYFDGAKNDAFAKKIQAFFSNSEVEGEFPYLKKLDFIIHSHNTFPHSAGIASSASAMSALALCLCSIEQEISGNPKMTDADFYRRASYFARIGSGSASRSVFGQMSAWGASAIIPSSSDTFATPYELPVHKDFKNFYDTILIVSKGEKKVSSRAGHGLMDGNPFAAARYGQASQNLGKLIKAIEVGDMSGFISIVENEALTLHGMMMASTPGYMLMEPNTLKIIKKIQAFREQSGLNLCFTLDAGPNVHVLYPEIDKTGVKEFIEHELKPLCESGKVIEDKMGNGPKRIR